jgi:hypothetical protein
VISVVPLACFWEAAVAADLISALDMSIFTSMIFSNEKPLAPLQPGLWPALETLSRGL